MILIPDLDNYGHILLPLVHYVNANVTSTPACPKPKVIEPPVVKLNVVKTFTKVFNVLGP